VEIIVGRGLLHDFRDLEESNEMQIGSKRWRVVGALSSPGTRFDSEIWCDRNALMNVLRRDSLTSMVVRLDRPESHDVFSAQLKLESQPLDVISERSYYRRMLEDIDVYLQAAAVVMLVLALGSTIACTNSMYTCFLGRTREFATLLAIGFSHGRIALLVLVESIALGVAGGATGILLVFTVAGLAFRVDELQATVSLEPTLRVLLAGLGMSIVVGLLGGLAGAFHSRALRPLTTRHMP
jgi:putative ABC transport system permease protein